MKIKLLIIACLLSCPAAVLADPWSAQNTYMPTRVGPEGDYETYKDALNRRAQTVVAGVPSYLWRHGCGPTAAGMVIGYHDGSGYPLLIPGDASTQTNAVDQAIATGDGAGTHYSDYSQPIDSPPNLQQDKSQLGGAHTPHDCLGDFMQTSWSSRGNYYGWSWNTDVPGALTGYTNTYINNTYSAGYTATSWFKWWGHSTNPFTFADLVAEINANRPMVFLVDSNGDGDTDHFVPAIGYRLAGDVNPYDEYAFFDTWDNNVHWEKFHYIGQDDLSWGVHSAMNYDIVPEPATIFLLLLGGIAARRRRR